VLATLLGGICLAAGGYPAALVGIPGLLVFGIIVRAQVARFTGSTAKPLLAALNDVAATMTARPAVQPAPSAPAAPPTAGAGWLPDPSSRHELRYWNGARWTEHVNDSGAPSLDPTF
jgi:hypothetical protein